MSTYTPTEPEQTSALMCHIFPLLPLGILIALMFTGIKSDSWTHVLLFSRLIFPLLGWIVGQKEDSPWIVHHAKNALNFQINYSTLFYIPLIAYSIMANDIISDFMDCPDDNLPIEEHDYMPTCNTRITRLEAYGLLLVLLPIAISFIVIEAVLLLIHVILVLRAANFAVNPIEKNVGETSRLIYPETYPLVIPFFRTSQNSR